MAKRFKIDTVLTMPEFKTISRILSRAVEREGKTSLKKLLSSLTGNSPKKRTKPRKAKRKMSAATKAKMRASQKKRWAEKKAGEKK